jgi:NADH-quinone oxidoreductase subunit A
VQFDLRFYVVALLFVIFDVEMAFFFPWAVVFGKANQLANPELPTEQRAQLTQGMTGFGADPAKVAGEEAARLRWQQQNWEEVKASFERRINDPQIPDAQKDDQRRSLANHMANVPTLATIRGANMAKPGAARSLAWMAFFDILFFFGVILVGFAYLWRRGDLNWVRSLAAQKEG